MAGVLSSIFDPGLIEEQRDRSEQPSAQGTDAAGANPEDDGDGAAGGRLDGAFETPQSSTETGGPEVVDIG